MAERVEKRSTDKVDIALVQRVVPGKLVYIETKPDEVYAIRLDQIVIRKPDGSYEHYRGEPLTELGLDSGKKVVVWTDSSDTKPRNVVVDPANVSRTFIGSTFSNFTGYFKR